MSNTNIHIHNYPWQSTPKDFIAPSFGEEHNGSVLFRVSTFYDEVNFFIEAAEVQKFVDDLNERWREHLEAQVVRCEEPIGNGVYFCTLERGHDGYCTHVAGVDGNDFGRDVRTEAPDFEPSVPGREFVEAAPQWTGVPA